MPSMPPLRTFVTSYERWVSAKWRPGWSVNSQWRNCVISTKSPTCDSPPCTEAFKTSKRSARRSSDCGIGLLARKARVSCRSGLSKERRSSTEMPASFDSDMMARALRLAKRGLYTTDPNPRVGCVIVREEEIVGEGYTSPVGGPHAEVNALQMAGEAARGATASVTLEPGSHHGRPPPCTDALIKAGVKRVVYAVADPNPQVNGGGAAALEAAGIKVSSGLLAAQAREINIGFFKRMLSGRPWVTVKLGASID